MHTFTIEQVAETLDKKRSDVDFLLYTHRLLLASEAPGALTRREFPLIDVYILALAFELVRLSGRRDEVCRALDRFLWWQHVDSEDAIREHRGLPKLSIPERMAMKQELAAKYAADPGAAGECFKPHELHWPWFVAAFFDGGKLYLRANDDTGFWHNAFLGRGSMLVVNMTRLIADVDAALVALMEDA